MRLANTPVEASARGMTRWVVRCVVRGSECNAYGFASKTGETDDLPSARLFRVRYPRSNEPFIETLHRVATVKLSRSESAPLRSRSNRGGNVHAVGIQYLTINATIPEYGDLPANVKPRRSSSRFALSFQRSTAGNCIAFRPQ